MPNTIRLLVLEDDPADARLVGLMLRTVPKSSFVVDTVSRLREAEERLKGGGYDVVLADLSVPDSSGLATLTALTRAAPHMPVLVLTGNDDDQLALDSLKHGAQDYLVKGRGDGPMLARVIRYAIERKAGERALAEARDKAEGAARAKSLFLAMMGHEIRTPLNGILGMGRLLLDSNLDSRQRVFVETVFSSGELLLGLVNDILDFSRLEAEGLTLDRAPFHVLDTVEEIRLLLAPRAAEKGLTFGCRFSPQVEPLVLGDPLRFRQILLNLIGNAIKFTEAGSVTLGVAVASPGTGEGGQRLRFTVTDTGIGIPETLRPDLFTEFSQGDPSIARRFGGTGLGLAICKRLVKLMGGEIGFENVAEGGSCFWFEVPFAPAPAGSLAVTVEAPAATSGEPRRVLLVDDNEVNREVAANLLQRHGHSVVTVEDGATAVAEAAAGTFDLVLLDMHMPGMDGIETARAIRALEGPGGQVRLYLLTANPADLDEAEWREAGIEGCMGKPFRVEETLRLLAGGGPTPPSAPPGLVALPDLLADTRDLGRGRMQNLAELFRRSSRGDLNAVLSAAQSGDDKAMATAAHRLAGASASLHLTALLERCRAIESAVRKGHPNAAARTEGLEDLWERSVAALCQVLDADAQAEAVAG